MQTAVSRRPADEGERGTPGLPPARPPKGLPHHTVGAGGDGDTDRPPCRQRRKGAAGRAQVTGLLTGPAATRPHSGEKLSYRESSEPKESYIGRGQEVPGDTVVVLLRETLGWQVNKASSGPQPQGGGGEQSSKQQSQFLGHQRKALATLASTLWTMGQTGWLTPWSSSLSSSSLSPPALPG